METSIRDQIEAIKDRHECYWRSDEALKEAIAVWGAEGHVNDCGVFAGYETEAVAKSGRAIAEVGIYKVRDGIFVHCTQYLSATGGSGYAPCVWSAEPHASANDARNAGITELMAKFGDEREPHEQTGREDLREIRRQLRGLVEQPSLF